MHAENIFYSSYLSQKGAMRVSTAITTAFIEFDNAALRNSGGTVPEIHRINPFKCCMWKMHDRLCDDGTTPEYRTLVESIRLQGQKQPALGR